MLEHNQYHRLNYNRKESKNAVALSYDQDKDAAPVVVASGAGHVAEKILELADKAGIPIYKDDTATALLSQLELGKEIPFELYEIVAQIFAYILNTSEQMKNRE